MGTIWSIQIDTRTTTIRKTIIESRTNKEIVSRMNQDCPCCNDNVADLEQHLAWCERRFINIAKRFLGLMK